ncbi:MAG: crosslink repair DNA glycosylase YcaQ family protein [Chloroflexota bacterium]
MFPVQAITISPTLARRLFITRQRLAGPRPTPNAMGIMDVARDLRCLQLDPTSAVARSHLLVLWSRLGVFDTAELDRVMWQERQLFEYWAHAASIVLTEDYPLHHLRMRAHPSGGPVWSQRVQEWIRNNQKLRRHILTRLRRDGPLLSRELEADGVDASNWISSGWTSERNVARMLDFLWAQGKIMVTARVGGQKQWDLAERCLPEWTPRERLTERAGTERAAQFSLRALGVGTAKHIAQHFMRGRYPHLADTLAQLEHAEQIVRVQIGAGGAVWPGVWYIHADDVPLLDRLRAGEWAPRTTLLSPFDNLICDRARTEQLFDFFFRIEIYVPKAKRQHGYFVLPILHGDRLIGRVDPLMDRQRQRLTINAIHLEPTAPTTRATARAVRAAIEELGKFLGAADITYGARVPDEWKNWI